MPKIRCVIVLLGMLLCSAAYAEVHVSIGVNLPVYPDLAVVPGYPVYYAPRMDANYFFYDGMYWVYEDDDWYSSTWYNGPWSRVGREVVPSFVLRIPVRYYRRPPAYFRGWRSDAPPRWGHHWGRDWERRRSGWDRWERRAAPAPAPLPIYQRHYSRDRYPRLLEQQHELGKRNYRYQPRDPVVRRHYEERAVQRAPARQGTPQRENRRATEPRRSTQQSLQPSTPHRLRATPTPQPQSPRRGGKDVQDSTRAPQTQGRPRAQELRQSSQPAAGQRTQQPPRSQRPEKRQRDRDASQDGKRPRAQDQAPKRPRAQDQEPKRPRAQDQEQRRRWDRAE